MRIRNANPADIEALVRLQKAAPQASQWAAEDYERAIAGSPVPRLTLVAETNSGVIGFVTSREVEHEWEIENVIVSPSARRKGAATKLLHDLLNSVRAANGNKVFLEVRESNVAAQRLYEKLGFDSPGRRKLYYRQPDEDALVYVLEF